MKKKLVVAAICGAFFALTFIVGFILGEAHAEDPNYLGVVYGCGQRSAIEAIESFLNAPKANETFGHLGEEGYYSDRVLAYSMDGLDEKGTGDSYWILWCKCSNGKIIMDRAKSYNDIPFD